MEKIQIFNNPDFGDIRTVIIDNEPWFVGKDLSKSLGYKDNTSAMRNVDSDDKRGCRVSTPSGIQKMTTVNESGMYSLIFGSKLDSAKKFKRWVTKEVLPSIRKTGSYGQEESTKQKIQLLAQGTTELYQRVECVEERIKGLEDTMNLDHGQQRQLEKAVNKTVINVLGGKESDAYKQIGRKVFCECNGNLKDYFRVNARGDVPRKRYEEALTYAEKWRPCTNTHMLIEQYNAQQRLDV